MSKKQIFNIKFLVENEAFQGDNWQPEIASILENITSQVKANTFNSLCHTHAINDSNGNHVGYFCFDEIQDGEVL